MADGRVGGEIARWLLEHYRHDVALIAAVSEGAITAAARAAGVPWIIYESSAQLHVALVARDLTPDLGMLAWWPALVRSPLLELPRHGFVNTHPSLLPHNRGKHYNFWAIVERAPFGVSLHLITAGVDDGDIVAQRALAYDWTDTGGTLYEKAASAMVALFRDSYPVLRTLEFERRPQAPGAGSFHRAAELDAASRIDLDQSYTARELLDRLRARTFAGHPGCWFTDDGATYEVRVAITSRDT